MTEPETYVFDPDYCMSPGVFLQEMLESAGLKGTVGVRMVANLAGLEPSVVEGILNGTTEINAEIAGRLAIGTQPLAVTAQFWLNAEQLYRNGLKAGKTDVSDEYRWKRA